MNVNPSPQAIFLGIEEAAALVDDIHFDSHPSRHVLIRFYRKIIITVASVLIEYDQFQELNSLR